jgi:sarcosine oxidase subunit gamma
MAEPARNIAALASRRHALNEPPTARRDISITLLPPEARFSLRLPIGAAADEVVGFQLAMPINRYEAKGKRWSARLGPNEWLIGGPEADDDAIAEEIEAALSGQIHGLTDIAHRNVAFEAAGAEASAVINAGCPLDLSTKAFPGGSATRTVLGKVEIVLIRPGDEPTFRIECWRSFARYVHDFLCEAARDCPALG